MKYVIGVDLGTSATKTILVDQNGKIVAEASVKYPMYQPENDGQNRIHQTGQKQRFQQLKV